MTDNKHEHRIYRSYLARCRASQILTPGDRLYIRRGCDERRVTVTLRGTEGFWLCSATLSDISAVNILRVNGTPVDFTTPLADRNKESQAHREAKAMLARRQKLWRHVEARSKARHESAGETWPW